MKSYLTIVGLCLVLVIVVFVGHHLDMPGRVKQERNTLLGGGSNTSELVAAVGQINVTSAHEEPQIVEAEPTEAVVTEATAPNGQQVYESGCVACHGAGIAGAPRVGDANAWTTRIAQGMDSMVDHAVNGFQGSQGMMPAKGGNPSLSDEEIQAAVEYMVAKSQ